MNEFEQSVVAKFGADVGEFLVNELRWFRFSDCADLIGVNGARVADLSDAEQVRAFEASRAHDGQVAEHQVWRDGKGFWLGLNHS